MPRRYKMLRKTRRPARPFKLMVKPEPTVCQQMSDEHRAKYPSHDAGPKNFIAYNKGAYQVIPAADIKHIGR